MARLRGVAEHPVEAFATAISTPMGIEFETSEAASSRGFYPSRHAEVTRLVTVWTVSRALGRPDDYLYRSCGRVFLLIFSFSQATL